MTISKTNLNLLFVILILSSITFACGKVTVSTSTSTSSENQLYFCERYDTEKGEINKGDKFPPGSITIIVNCQGKKEKLGVSEIDLHVTNLGTNEVTDLSYPVNPDYDYIYFNNFAFPDEGKYKVVCAKKDGTAIASGQVEIANK